MVKLKEALNSREVDLIKEYQSTILKTDIEDGDSVSMYQNLIAEIIVKAKKRYYAESPTVISIKTAELHKELINKNPTKVNDLFTAEEAEKVAFLRWRMTRSFFPWTRRRKENLFNHRKSKEKRRDKRYLDKEKLIRHFHLR